ncbi:sucrose-6-phosphate hydrolase [Mycena floridula]|nr:sucrose-6-phosphate hydrolase [Mycena floridula]
MAFYLTIALSAALSGATNLDPSVNLNTLPNNELFTRWRPTFHFLGPSGWMNDPCGSMYDPVQDVYHLLYQFHPNHVDWGNISWGHATSKDLITWTDISGWANDEAEALGTGGPGTPDHLGVFSGTGQSINLNGVQDGNLTLMFTAVKLLPIGTPYIPGTETQSLATSSDGGLTWDKFPGNPVIPDPPGGWDVIGFRDPFFLAWPEMDLILQQTTPHYYVVFGSSIRGVGPRIPLYSAPASDLTKWTFLGALFEIPNNFIWGGDFTKTGSFGTLFEVPGAFSLVEEEENGGDGSTTHFYITTGTQGGARQNWVLWAEGIVSRRDNGSAQFDFLSSGARDWGNLYAVSSFWDPKNNRRVSWGWTDEQMNGYATKPQGFQGSLGLPAELFVLKTHQVIAPASGVPSNSSDVWRLQTDGTYTVTTLGVRPLSDVIDGLRLSDPLTRTTQDPITQSLPILNDDASAVKSDHFELKATLANITGSAGFIVRASPGSEEFTTISYTPANNTVSVVRSSSSLIKNFGTSTITGYFAPYTTTTAGLELLTMDIFVDGSIVEVFINDRFALTTRIYPSRDDALAVSQFVSNGGSAVFQEINVWIEMRNVWPDRPVNSSSTLITDSSADTGNGAWWSGN